MIKKIDDDIFNNHSSVLLHELVPDGNAILARDISIHSDIPKGT